MDWKKIAKKAGNVALGVGEMYVGEMKSQQNQLERKMEMYDRYSDDELRGKLKTTSDSLAKKAIIQILKNRGY